MTGETGETRGNPGKPGESARADGHPGTEDITEDTELDDVSFPCELCEEALGSWTGHIWVCERCRARVVHHFRHDLLPEDDRR